MVYDFGDSVIFAFWFEIAYLRPLLGGFGHISSKCRRSNPERTLLVRKHVAWAIRRFDLMAKSRQPRCNKRRHIGFQDGSHGVAIFLSVSDFEKSEKRRKTEPDNQKILKFDLLGEKPPLNGFAPNVCGGLA